MEHKNIDKTMVNRDKQIGFWVHTHTWLFDITGHEAFEAFIIIITHVYHLLAFQSAWKIAYYNLKRLCYQGNEQ